MKKNKKNVEHKTHLHVKDSRSRISTSILIENHDNILKGTLLYVESEDPTYYYGWIEFTNRNVDIVVPKYKCKNIWDFVNSKYVWKTNI